MAANERILVAGAGALGSVFGGFLRRAGFDVTLLGRAPHMDAIAARGLAIDGIWGEHRVIGLRTATDPGQLEGRFDAVLLTVKSFDTEVIAASVRPHLDDAGFAISLQNGLGNVEKVERVFGSERTLGARVIFGAAIPAPGRAHVSVFADPNALGSLNQHLHPRREAAARLWAGHFADAGVPSLYCDDLPSRLWAKVLYNAALNPLGALLGVHYGVLPEREESRAIMDDVLDEAFRVAGADGAVFPWDSAADYRREFYGRLVPSTYHHRPSMLQDLEAGRRTEIDAINGEVVRRGAAHGIVTPVNETLVRLVMFRGAGRGARDEGR